MTESDKCEEICQSMAYAIHQFKRAMHKAPDVLIVHAEKKLDIVSGSWPLVTSFIHDKLFFRGVELVFSSDIPTWAMYPAINMALLSQQGQKK